MSERRDVEYIGQYRCSARAKETLRRGEAYVDSAMVDWSLFAEFSDEFSLDVERDNKSVWDPRWLVRGLARFGSSVPASLATKFRRPEPLREARPSRGASNQKESPRGASSASPRTVGSASRHQRGRSDFDFTFLNGGRAVLSDRRTRNFGGSGTPGFDPAIYERWHIAVFSMAALVLRVGWFGAVRWQRQYWLRRLRKQRTKVSSDDTVSRMDIRKLKWERSSPSSKR
nr:MAG: hypothetical protein H4BulkLitter2320831_000001 [Partitiviridae sp.]